MTRRASPAVYLQHKATHVLKRLSSKPSAHWSQGEMTSWWPGFSEQGLLEIFSFWQALDKSKQVAQACPRVRLCRIQASSHASLCKQPSDQQAVQHVFYRWRTGYPTVLCSLPSLDIIMAVSLPDADAGHDSLLDLPVPVVPGCPTFAAENVTPARKSQKLFESPMPHP